MDLAWDRVDDLPTNYLRNAIASTLASRMVYHEGIHAIESQPADSIADRAFEYHRKTEEINGLMIEIAEAQQTGHLDIKSQEKVIELLCAKAAPAPAASSSRCYNTGHIPSAFFQYNHLTLEVLSVSPIM